MYEDEEKLWVTCPVKDPIDLGEGYIIPEYIRANIGKWGWGDTVAFESAETGRKYTFNQVLDQSRAFATGLIKLKSDPELNFDRKDVVAVLLQNVPEYPSILCGIWEAHLVANPINPLSVERDISLQLETSRAKVIITSSEYLDVARAVKAKSKIIKKIIIVDVEGPQVKELELEINDCVSYFEMLEADTAGVEFFSGSQITKENDNDVALLTFSSGTSGHPKGVMLTHFGLLSSMLLFSNHQVNEVSKNKPERQLRIGRERVIAVVPFFHIYGISLNIFVNIFQGAHVITLKSFTPVTFTKLLGEFKPTILYGVPTLLSFICNNDNIGSLELDHLNYIICGGAPCGVELFQRILSKAKNAKFVESYGLTEISLAATVSRLQRHNGSVGQPLPYVVIKILDVGTGLALVQGQLGEICIKTPCIMKGYLNNEQATLECIDNEGWFHTGDVGHYDEDGCLFIVDRLKELIKVKGFQVAPAELEDVIRTHEKVADVGVIGVPHEIMGEVPRAFIVSKPGSNLTAEEIISFVDSRVTSYKRLRGGVQFVSEIPKGGSGKILRRVLKEKERFKQK